MKEKIIFSYLHFSKITNIKVFPHSSSSSSSPSRVFALWCNCSFIRLRFPPPLSLSLFFSVFNLKGEYRSGCMCMWGGSERTQQDPQDSLWQPEGAEPTRLTSQPKRERYRMRRGWTQQHTQLHVYITHFPRIYLECQIVAESCLYQCCHSKITVWKMYF